MSDFTFGVTHGINFDPAVGARLADLDFLGAMAHDLSIVVGRVLITISRGVKVRDALSGSIVQTLDRVQSVMATQQMVQDRDIDQSNGKLRIGDRKFRFERADLEWDPALGDKVLMEGDSRVYEVVGPDTMVFKTSFLVWCRA